MFKFTLMALAANMALSKDKCLEMPLHVRKNKHKRQNELVLSLTQENVFEKDLTDYFDIQLYTILSFGSNKESHTLIFDTGSSWLWV